jgi:predicted ATPase
LFTELSPDGRNLDTAIFELKNFNELSYRRVLDYVRRLEPDLQAVNFAVVPLLPPVPFVTLHNKQAPWGSLSDGTLRALAIAYLVEVSRQGETPGLTLIEEPENGIAPFALRGLFDLFEERAAGAQFLFTSHSPYFIDLFDGERGAVTLLEKRNHHTVIISPPAAEISPDRLTLAEQYALELIP